MKVIGNEIGNKFNKIRREIFDVFRLTDDINYEISMDTINYLDFYLPDNISWSIKRNIKESLDKSK